MYFAVTIGSDYHLGLDPYLELTGMAYRITPTRSEDGRHRVNTEVMYDNMMNKFRYGNVNKPGIYLDENTLRMCRTHRMMFSELAEALYQEGQEDKAIKVLDYAEQMLPGYNVSYDYTSASMASLYYALGETDKANKMMSAIADNALEYLAWGASLDYSSKEAAQSTIGHYSAILRYVLQNLETFTQKELFNKYFEQYRQYVALR